MARTLGAIALIILYYDTVTMTMVPMFLKQQQKRPNLKLQFNEMKSINFPFSLQIQKVHFCLNNFKKLDLVRFEEQMGRAGIKHTYSDYLFIYKQC